jgi:hypothetical protein
VRISIAQPIQFLSLFAMLSMASTGRAMGVTPDPNCNVTSGLRYCVVDAVALSGVVRNQGNQDVAVRVQLTFTNEASSDVNIALAVDPIVVSIGGVSLNVAQSRDQGVVGLERCSSPVDMCLNSRAFSLTSISAGESSHVVLTFLGTKDPIQRAAIAGGQSPLLSGRLILVGAGHPRVATMSLRGFKLQSRMTP